MLPVNETRSSMLWDFTTVHNDHSNVRKGDDLLHAPCSSESKADQCGFDW